MKPILIKIRSYIGQFKLTRDRKGIFKPHLIEIWWKQSILLAISIMYKSTNLTKFKLKNGCLYRRLVQKYTSMQHWHQPKARQRLLASLQGRPASSTRVNWLSHNQATTHLVKGFEVAFNLPRRMYIVGMLRDLGFTKWSISSSRSKLNENTYRKKRRSWPDGCRAAVNTPLTTTTQSKTPYPLK